MRKLKQLKMIDPSEAPEAEGKVKIAKQSIESSLVDKSLKLKG